MGKNGGKRFAFAAEDGREVSCSESPPKGVNMGPEGRGIDLVKSPTLTHCNLGWTLFLLTYYFIGNNTRYSSQENWLCCILRDSLFEIPPVPGTFSHVSGYRFSLLPPVISLLLKCFQIYFQTRWNYISSIKHFSVAITDISAGERLSGTYKKIKTSQSLYKFNII